MPNEYLKDGDISFVGLNSRDNPSSLPKGIVSRSQNFRLDRGIAQTRKGLQRKTIGSIINQNIFGAGTYIQPNGQEIIVLVVANGLYTYNPQTETLSSKIYFPNHVTGKTLTCSDSITVTINSVAHGLNVGDKVYVEASQNGYTGLFVITIKTNDTFTYTMPAVASHGPVGLVSCSYSASELITTTDGCDVCSAMDKIFISRGFDKRPLMWDLANTIIALPSHGTGVEFPNCSTLLYYANRLVAIGKYHLEPNSLRNYDSISVSNYLDYTDWDVADVFTVNNGSNDQLVGVSPWTLNEFLVFMRNSIYYVSVGSDRYVTGAPLSTDSYIKTLATDIGCSARKSVVQAGGGVFFLSDNGVYFLQPQQSSQDSMKLLTMSDPISAPIDDIIQRINKNYSSNAVATYWNNRYYLAVPLDNSTVNNTVLVFNFILKQWESVDTYPTLVQTGNSLVAYTASFYTTLVTANYYYLNVQKYTTPRHGLAVGDYINLSFGKAYLGATVTNYRLPDGTYKVVNITENNSVLPFFDTTFSVEIPKSSFVIQPYDGTNWIFTGTDDCTFSKAESVSLKDFIVVKKDNQRRMFLIDNYQGIFLTEQLDHDEFGNSTGGPILPIPIANVDTNENIAKGLYGNLILVSPLDANGNPNPNVIILDPLAFTKNDILAVLETRQYTMDSITDKRFSSYEANILTAGGERVETYAEIINPDVSVKVDSLGSSSLEDYNRSNPVRKIGSGATLKFVSYSKRPSIRSAFIYATQQKKNNINKE
jgi:hypothetical protein